MAPFIATYVREKGEILAFFEGNVIARGTSFAKVEESAVDYLDHLSRKRDGDALETVKKAATHIVTPNGLKGEILGRVDGQWGEKEITVRFENGRIAKFMAHGSADVQYVNGRTASTNESRIGSLQADLDADYDRDLKGLTLRSSALSDLIKRASVEISKSAHDEAEEIHKIILLARNESEEIGEAIAYLQNPNNEPFQPPKFAAVEQGEMGRAKQDSWLDNVARKVFADVEAQDFDKILVEEPALLVAGLDTGTLVTPSFTEDVASEFITSKTATFNGPEVDRYRELFLAATEVARQAELADRESQQTTTKEASVEDNDDGPAEGLFL